MNDTIFDKILRKEIPAKIVYEDEFVLAFHDIEPQAPTHVLVIPKKKYKSFSALKTANPTEIGEYMCRISKVANLLSLDEGGYRVVFNTGSDALQSVPYIHAHILGGRPMKWPPG